MTTIHPLGGISQGLAAQGRYGDDALIHVKRSELNGLAALTPSGRLTTNPHTGLPEAFGASGILGILGSLAGVLAAPFTGGTSLALTGAIGGGLGTFAGGLIDGKDVGSALGGGLVSGLLGYGLGSAAGVLADAGGSTAASEAAKAAAAPVALQPGAAGVGAMTEAGYGGDAIKSALAGGVDPYATAAGNTPMGNQIGQQAVSQFGSPSLSAGAQSANPMESLMDRGGNVLRGATDPSALWGAAKAGAIPIGLGILGQGAFDTPNQGQKPYQPTGSPFLRPPPGMNSGRRYIPQEPDPRGYERNYFTPTQYMYAAGGGISGPGGGLDDAIPAMIDQRAPARLSSGEYVVPAHAVSALGNGSSEEGVRQMDGMVDKVMSRKFGTRNRKPRPIKPQAMMPV